MTRETISHGCRRRRASLPKSSSMSTPSPTRRAGARLQAIRSGREMKLHFPMPNRRARIIHLDMDAFYASVEQRGQP